jgi:aspartyl-tRNA(Asn)/glutamyl-tRNA(Gln) amidotransferase subunit A
MSATDLVAGYRAGKISPVEATKAALAQIAAHNGGLNAYCLIDEDGALQAARESEARWRRGQPIGLVDGVPSSIKDVVLTRGWPTLRGSRAIARDQAWDEDAPVTARLREHGAVLLGKTTTPEFGWKGVTDSPLTGITRNPWNPELTPGGSSGGAAAAAAAGMGTLHIGTDGGGSIRIPAAFTGIFGFKQSFGRVPAYPLSPFGTLAHVGPMTRTVADAALMMNVLCRPDPRDWYALPHDGADYLDGLDGGVRELRVAFSADLGGSPVRPEVAALVARAVKVFAELGAIVDADDPGIAGSGWIFRNHWFAGAANALRPFTSEQRALMDPGLIEVAAQGERITLLDYLASVKEREAMGTRMNLFHQKWDLLLTPTMPLTAFRAGQETPLDHQGERWVDWTPFTYPFNLTRQPAATVPCGLTQAGLPVGLQIIGPSHADKLVLRAARAFERAAPFRMPGPIAS